MLLELASGGAPASEAVTPQNLYIVFGVVVGLVTAALTGFAYIMKEISSKNEKVHDRVSKTDEEVSKTQQRVGLLEQSQEHTQRQLNDQSVKIDKIETNVGEIKERMSTNQIQIMSELNHLTQNIINKRENKN